MKKAKFILILIAICSNGVFAQTGNIIVQNGNLGTIGDVVADEQGRYVYTNDGTKIVMWAIKTGDQLYSFTGEYEINQFVLSADGRYLAYATNSGVKCFNTVTGKSVLSIESSGVAFSADGKKIYTHKSDKLILEIDIISGKETILYEEGFKSYGTQVWLMDNNTLVFTNSDGWIVFDITNRRKVFEKKSDSFSRKTEFIPSQKLLIASTLSDFEFYDILTGKITKTLEQGWSQDRIFVSKNSKEFIIKGKDENTYLIYNSETFTIKKTFKIPELDITSNQSRTNGLFFQGSTKRCFVASANKLFQIDLDKSSTSVNFFKRKTINFIGFQKSEYNARSGILYLIANGSVGKFFDLSQMKTLQEIDLKTKAEVVAFTTTGDTAALFEDGKVIVKNTKTGAVILPSTPTGKIQSMIRNGFFFSSDGKVLYYLLENTQTDGAALMNIDIVSKIKSKTVQFHNNFPNINVHTDKNEIQTVESITGTHSARIYSLKTGNITFEKLVPRENKFGQYNEPGEIYIQLSKDKTKVLVAQQYTYSIYNYPSGNVILNEASLEANPRLGFIRKLDKTGANSANGDLSQFLVCSIGLIASYDANGKKQYEVNGEVNNLSKVLFSPDNKVFYTVSGEADVKAWEARTGKLYGTLYLFNDGIDFVFVTPDGRFDGTNGGMKRLYYYKDRNKINLDVVYEKFYTPNLYQRLINGELFEPINITINPLPLAKISYEQKTRNLTVEDDSKPAYNNTTGLAEITINASAENDKIDEIRLFHNGKIVSLATRGLFVTDNDNGTDSKKYTINLLAGQNTFRAIALNSQRTESQPDEIIVNYQKGNQPVVAPPKTTTTGVAIDKVDKNATLHLIVVGINQYQNKSMVLNYALADATAFKDELEKDAKSIIANIKTYFVTDNAATKTGITNAFKQVQETAKPQDVFVFYYAGHGVIGKDKEFYLVPNDVSDLKNAQAELESKGMPAKLMQKYAIDIPAQKQLFILDACQSAGAFNEMLSADGDQQKSIAVVSRSTGTHWMAASGAQQYANEFSQLGHGAFTYVLLEALKGSAAADKMITVNGLKNYLQQEVPELMKKYSGTLQYPASYGFGNDFPVEVLK